jgi:hypothetical protein
VCVTVNYNEAGLLDVLRKEYEAERNSHGGSQGEELYSICQQNKSGRD